MYKNKMPGWCAIRGFILLNTCLSLLLVSCIAVETRSVQTEPETPPPNNTPVAEKTLQPSPPPPPLKTAVEQNAEHNNDAEHIDEQNNIEDIIQASLIEDESLHNSPASTMSPEDIILSYETETFQNIPASTYTLAPGDIIEISVQGEDLTREIIIPPDGTISFFMIGQLQITGMSIEDLRLEVEDRLNETLPSPTVIIHGKNLAGGAAEIIGAVNLPGYKQIQQGDRLADLLAKAGGLLYFSFDDETIEPELEADPANAFFARDQKHFTVDLPALFEEDSLENNPEIMPGDFLYIPRRQREGIQVVGEVNQPVNLDFRQDFTIQDAVSLAGGIRQNVFGKEIFLIRGTLNNLEVMRISYQDIKKGIEEDQSLLSGDILFVPKTFVLDLSKLPILLLPQLDALLRSESAE